MRYPSNTPRTSVIFFYITSLNPHKILLYSSTQSTGYSKMLKLANLIDKNNFASKKLMLSITRCYFIIGVSYLPNPSTRAGYDTRSIFKRSLTGLNSEFSFSETSYLTKAEELSQPYYLPIPGGRLFGFISFPRVLVPCKMQSVLSRVWSRVAVSIFNDDNH